MGTTTSNMIDGEEGDVKVPVPVKVYILRVSENASLRIAKYCGDDCQNGYRNMVKVLDFSDSMSHSYDLLRTVCGAALSAGSYVSNFGSDAVLIAPGETARYTYGCTNYTAALRVARDVISPDTVVDFFTDGMPNEETYQQATVIGAVHKVLAQGDGYMRSVFLSKQAPSPGQKQQLEALCTPGQVPLYTTTQEL